MGTTRRTNKEKEKLKMTRFIDNWGKEYRVEQEEFKNFSDEMAKNGRRFARIQTLGTQDMTHYLE